MKLNTIIVDDEPLAQKGLEDYIKEVNFLELVGKAEDPVEASSLLTSLSVDLMFLDIQMPKLSGIEYLKKMKNPPLVIICSAFAEYALEGYELDVLDYLIKPVAFDRFFKAVVKAKEYCELKQKNNQSISAEGAYFFIKCNNKIEKISMNELLFVEGTSNFVTIHTSHRKLVSYLTMKNVESFLPAELFVRIHKSYLVQINKIDQIDASEAKIGKYHLPISRHFREALIEKIDTRIVKRG
jgi:two-component system, LytTR family, response regulator